MRKLKKHLVSLRYFASFAAKILKWTNIKKFSQPPE